MLLCLALLGLSYFAYQKRERLLVALDPNPAPARALPASTVISHHVDESETRFRDKLHAAEEAAFAEVH